MDYIEIMENKMETTIMENQMEKKWKMKWSIFPFERPPQHVHLYFRSPRQEQPCPQGSAFSPPEVHRI